MENAVNNLLISKKQIDALNTERISLIRIYESKLNEQNAQINYLNEENCKLKSIINNLNSTTKKNGRPKTTNNKITTICSDSSSSGSGSGESGGSSSSKSSSSSCNNTTTSCSSSNDVNHFVCHCNNSKSKQKQAGNNNNNEQRRKQRSKSANLLIIKKYELCLDNIMRQLLNSLKIQETIRIEYLKQSIKNNNNNNSASLANKQSHSKPAATSNKLTNNEKLNSNNCAGGTNLPFCTSNSWTFNNNHHHNGADSSCSSSSSTSIVNNNTTNNDENNNINSNNINNDNNCGGNSRFHFLLLKQQKQQLSILSELNKISKYIKMNKNEHGDDDDDGVTSSPTHSVSSRLVDDDSIDNNVSSLSNLESSSVSIDQKHNESAASNNKSTQLNENKSDCGKSKPIRPINNENRTDNNGTNCSATCSSNTSNAKCYARNLVKDTGLVSAQNHHSSNQVNHKTVVSLASRIQPNPCHIQTFESNKQSISCKTDGLKTTTIIQIKNFSPPHQRPNQQQTATKIDSERKKENRVSRIPVKLKETSQSCMTKSPCPSVKSTATSSSSTSKSNFKQLSTKSKIPQLKTEPKSSNPSPTTTKNQYNNFENTTTNNNNNNNNKYNTYTKKKQPVLSENISTNTNTLTTTNIQTTSLVNSETFDKSTKPQKKETSSTKLECSEIKLILANNNPVKTSKVDIVLVPVPVLNNKHLNESEDVQDSSQSKQQHTKSVKLREDEGYSTMSSELMHQIRGTTTSPPTTNQKAATGFNINKKARSKKRYCFPTLKSFSYYYNNRYYHQYHQETTTATEGEHNQAKSVCGGGGDGEGAEGNKDGDEFLFLDEKVCCKYLSDTDISSLINQLSSYDKDLSYNVFHLDTLYNNVDYILFNSYASDTELVYNSNRRNLRNQHFLNSNYKLYINDYFNQPYEQEEEDDDETSGNDENKSINKSDREEDDECEEGEYQIEPEFIQDDSECNMIELSVDNNDEDDDGLVYDDDDYNLLLMMKNSKSNDTPKSTDFKLSEYKKYLFSGSLDHDDLHQSPPMFSSQTSLYLNTSSNSRTSSSSSNSHSCSTCSSRSSVRSNLSSIESPNSMLREASIASSSSSSVSSSCNNSPRVSDRKKAQKRTSRSRRRIDPVGSSQRHNHHHHHHKHHHHRRHEYFTHIMDKQPNENFYEKCDMFDETNQMFIDKLDLDDFVTKLNMQCKMDKTIAANEKTSKHLKELNILAAKAVVAAAKQNHGVDQSDMISQMQSPRPNCNLIRRHTITSMPISAASVLDSPTKQVEHQTNNINAVNANNSTPTRTMDSRAYVGSFTRTNSSCGERQPVSSSLNSTPTRRCSFYTIQKTLCQSPLVENNINKTAQSSCGSHSKLFMMKNNAIKPNVSSKHDENKATSNNFNTDFYRLCSDTLYYGSDANLNPLPSPIAHNLHLINENNLPSSQDDLYKTPNISAHVNNLFDQWLINSGTSK